MAPPLPKYGRWRVFLRLPIAVLGLAVSYFGFATVLAVAGNALIVEAMRLSDLSVLGPINSYKSVVSLVPAFALLGELPGVWGATGILAILAGSVLLRKRRIEPGERRLPLRTSLIRDRGGPVVLDGKLLIASLNRGGLAGAAWEMDDPITGPSPAANRRDSP